MSAVWLQYGLDTVVVRGYDSTRVVRGAVVHHNDLCISVSLVERAVDCLGQETSVVVVVDDDAGEAFTGHRTLPENNVALPFHL